MQVGVGGSGICTWLCRLGPDPESANAASSPGAWFKYTTGEGGLRVPLIVTTTGMKESRVEQGLGQVTHIAATICSVANSAPIAPG